MTDEFEGDVLGPIAVEDAKARVLAYCTAPSSGWNTYDLAAMHLRDTGLFDTVSSWSLLFANTLNGQVTLGNLADFTAPRREEFAERLRRVPFGKDLDRMTDVEVDSVIDACSFGFSGVWAPKVTKVGALYRPHGIPVLDGHVAQAFGFSRDAFSTAAAYRGRRRPERIAAVVKALRSGLASQRETLNGLRRDVQGSIPEIRGLSDLRLLDMIIWTSQDDRMPRRISQGPRWTERGVGAHLPLAGCVSFPARPR